ncbi:MAG: hypothetical protein ACR2N6_00490 [Miltoncostaeaceae bacterium]
MLDPFCWRCGCRVLVTPAHIVEMSTDECGVTVRWRCACGELGTELVGRPAAGRRPTRSAQAGSAAL